MGEWGKGQSGEKRAGGHFAQLDAENRRYELLSASPCPRVPHVPETEDNLMDVGSHSRYASTTSGSGSASYGSSNQNRVPRPFVLST